MNTDRKQCTACQTYGTRASYSKRQWEEQGPCPVRCADCIKAKRGDPIRMRKEEERRAEYRRIHFPPDESQMERRCAACRQREGEHDNQVVTFINCPFCIHASPAGKRTKLCVCANRRPCYESAIRHHFQSGECQRQLEVQELRSVYTGYTRSSYDDPYEDEVVQSLIYPVPSEALSETTFGLIERWFYRRAYTCRMDNPVFELKTFREEATLDDELWAIHNAKGVLQFMFRGA